MSTGQCSRCRATYGCMCNGSQSTGANWDTVSNPMGALQSIIHEQSNEIRSLRAALDEANTERQRLAKDNERCSEAWRRVVLRQQRSDNAHDYDMQQIEAERDRAVAQVQRVEALCDEAVEENRPPNATNSEVLWLAENIRAALAGEGSEQP